MLGSPRARAWGNATQGDTAGCHPGHLPQPESSPLAPQLRFWVFQRAGGGQEASQNAAGLFPEGLKRGRPAELCLLGSSGLGVPGWETPSQGLGAQEWGLCPTVSPPWSHAWVSIRVLGMVVPGGVGFGALVCVLHWRAPERGANPAGHPLRKRTRLKKGRQKDRRKSSAEPPRRAGEAQARPGEGEGAEICRAGCASLSAGSD